MLNGNSLSSLFRLSFILYINGWWVKDDHDKVVSPIALHVYSVGIMYICISI